MAKRGPRPFIPGERLMGLHETADRLDMDYRTVKRLWTRGVVKLGGRVFLAYPAARNVILARVWAVDSEATKERDALQPGSLECLVASGRITL